MEYLWIFWLVVSVMFLAVEWMTVELISIWFTGAGLIAMIIALCGLSLEWQILAFCLVSVLLIIFTRPIVARHLKRNESKTNVDTLSAASLENTL